MSLRALTRSVPTYLALFAGTIALGLLSRSRVPLPSLFVEYGGDVLWAAMVFWILALIWRRTPTLTLAVAALAIAFADEFSQMYHAPWIDSIRHTTTGALALGNGFLWTDLVCYSIGVAIAAALDADLRARAAHRGNAHA